MQTLAIVGRPNVGKSSLFNVLTRSQKALVADQPGVTRDRLYAQAMIADRPFLVVDTGGMVESASDLEAEMFEQSRLAILEADCVLWVVDAYAGLTSLDLSLAQALRKADKPLILVMNKCEKLSVAEANAEFSRLGFPNRVPISAAHRAGIDALETMITTLLPPIPSDEETAEKLEGVRVAIVGRPNVGKSTLTNRILGEERVVVFDAPGTTTDSIYIPYEENGRSYVLIDTAGVRKRGRIEERVEKFSIIKTLKAIEDAQIVILVLDGSENVTEQDLHLLGFVEEQGKSLILAVNKWDHLPTDQRDWIKRELARRLSFVEYAPLFFISALHGSNVGLLLDAVDKAYRSASQTVSTHHVNDLMEEAVKTHQPPLVNGRRVKLRYGHLGGTEPPTIVIHGNQVNALPRAYKRYLSNFFRGKLNLYATPVRIFFKEGENPYKDKKNTLTKRQYAKRQRLIRNRKKQ